ncbi:class I SAM-dependent methyltransferase [Cellulosilyticum ruminicola]|uniref:class I SAM-dependent methyltransferase n=1 Tax=Cellulosilyticum ruminicola TaxID=425254 RepID=UPI0006D15873|nr:class I SAM-dependent methyltransferase [Cellulosilyticum ruminicola]
MMNYYNMNAQAFFNDTVNADMSKQYEDFLNLLPVGSKILDAGCGSGRDSLIFMNRGYEVVALDGAIEMCQLAGQYIGQEVVHMQFSEIDFTPIFDGIWASASLLHVPSYELEEILKKLKKALTSQGILYASFKYGDFEGKRNGRYYHDLSKVSAKELFSNLGFKILKIWITGDLREKHAAESWLNILIQNQ